MMKRVSTYIYCIYVLLNVRLKSFELLIANVSVYNLELVGNVAISNLPLCN